VTCLICRESICHVHGIVVYKDIDSPVRKNAALKEELEMFEAKLMKRWAGM
jgi:hypothetical protein